MLHTKRQGACKHQQSSSFCSAETQNIVPTTTAAATYCTALPGQHHIHTVIIQQHSLCLGVACMRKKHKFEPATMGGLCGG